MSRQSCLKKCFLGFSKSNKYTLERTFSSESSKTPPINNKKPKTQPLKKPVTPTGKLDDANVSKTAYLGSNVLEREFFE